MIASAHTVRCGDHGAAGDPEEWEVNGFPGPEASAEYARRFTGAQIEDLRPKAGSAGALRAMHCRRGEYALAEGLDHGARVAFCIANPATRRQGTDRDALEPGGAGAGRA